MSDTWIEINGVRCKARLTPTRIIVTMEEGWQRLYGAWHRQLNVSAYLDTAAPRSNYGPCDRVTWQGNYGPTKDAIGLIMYADPKTWPPCSDDIRDRLQACAERANVIKAERIEQEAKAAAKTAIAFNIADKRRALLAAAISLDEAELQAAAKAYREACNG